MNTGYQSLSAKVATYVGAYSLWGISYGLALVFCQPAGTRLTCYKFSSTYSLPPTYTHLYLEYTI